MYAAMPDDCVAVSHVLEGLSDRCYHIGDRAGMAQVLKLANNFLVGNALAATSEAVAFCTESGLDMATVLEVLNVSSGRSAASEDKFVNHVLTGAFASGFLNTLMAKDLDLFAAANDHDAPICAATVALWRRFAVAEPGSDFTAIYKFVSDR